MSNPSRLTKLQDRLSERQSRLHINKIVEQEPVPEYDKVGLELKARRERKGHELEMASRVLCIRQDQIRAIEESRYADFPGKTYAIGFVRSYAEYLGLNSEECVRRFKLEYAEALEPSEEEGKVDKKGLSFPEVRDHVRLPHGSIFILAGILVLAVWGGWYLTTSAERAFAETETVAVPPQNLPSPEDAEVILRAAQAAEPEIAGGAVPTPEADNLATSADSDVEGVAEAIAEPELQGPLLDGPITAAEQFVAALTGTGDGTVPVIEEETLLEVQTVPAPQPATTRPRDSQVFGVRNYGSRVFLWARANVWVRVEDADGTVLFEETLQRGDSYRVPDRPGLIMATRNAGALEVILDGQSLGPAGAIGQAILETSVSADDLGNMEP